MARHAHTPAIGDQPLAAERRSPWGDGTMSSAVDDALARSGGDAMLNPVVSSSLYTFIPLYNVFTYSCTEVSGTAIKFAAPAVP